MKRIQSTPGPWEVKSETGEFYRMIVDKDDVPIADCRPLGSKLDYMAANAAGSLPLLLTFWWQCWKRMRQFYANDYYAELA